LLTPWRLYFQSVRIKQCIDRKKRSFSDVDFEKTEAKLVSQAETAGESALERLKRLSGKNAA